MRGKLSYKLPLSLAAAAVVVGAVLSPVAGASNMPVATWTGAVGDNKFSTAGNWKEGRAPVDGAKLVFNCVATTTYESVTITNDISAKIAEISTLPTEGVDQCKTYDIKGDTHFQERVKFSGIVKGERNDGSPIVKITPKGLKHLIAGDTGVYINNSESMAPLESYTALGDQMYDTDFNTKRAIINSVDKGTIHLRRVSESITLQQGAVLHIDSYKDETFSTNITFQGDGTIGDGITKSKFTGGGPAGGGEYTLPPSTVTLSGDIVVNGTVSVKLESWETLKITGNLSGPGKIVAAPDNKGVIKIEAKSNTTKTETGVVDSTEANTVILEGDKKNEKIIVTRKQTAVLKGSRGSVHVVQGGILKGEGVVGTLHVEGVVAPGNSPGEITVLDNLTFSDTGTYQVEILNSDSYDKIITKRAWFGNGSGPTLQLTYLPNGKLKKGDTLTIVEVTSNEKIDGGFKGLLEGAEVRVGNATFIISYKGGDGNDITLTAQNDSVAPKAPNTGAASLVANPAVAVAGVAAAVVALFASSKRRATNKR